MFVRNQRYVFTWRQELHRMCDTCAKELSVAAGQPVAVNPRIDRQVPVFALGRYAGARRQAILAMKERGRGDLVAPLARALAVGVRPLLTPSRRENETTGNERD